MQQIGGGKAQCFLKERVSPAVFHATFIVKPSDAEKRVRAVLIKPV